MKLKLLVISLFALLSLVFAVANAGAQFNPLSDVCKKAPQSSACQQNTAQNGSNANPAIRIIREAANLIAVIAGIAAVIMVVISGFMFVTAGGGIGGQRASDPNRAKVARATLTAAIIGVVIIALAWTIVTFVTNQLVKT